MQQHGTSRTCFSHLRYIFHLPIRPRSRVLDVRRAVGHELFQVGGDLVVVFEGLELFPEGIYVIKWDSGGAVVDFAEGITTAELGVSSLVRVPLAPDISQVKPPQIDGLRGSKELLLRLSSFYVDGHPTVQTFQ